MSDKPANPILCAIDLADPAKAKNLVRDLKGAVGGIKLGLEFFTANGPRAVRDVAQGLPLFLDLKLYDIPNTVGRAVSAVVALLEPVFLTVHCAGGPAMMKAAAEAVKAEAAKHGGRKTRTKILGVTV
ncbi:MAG: orotidine 5'-phosphate decarboxylase / HUMPS family protein, partial [Stellaceae bacterium]